ncbi:hypothetical protein [Psychrilyobacter sp.]|uniref:hypothetical protein n=1 Tax=Psychrilyobacter sp. TaxID=2586924 RepID=UPI003018678B
MKTKLKKILNIYWKKEKNILILLFIAIILTLKTSDIPYPFGIHILGMKSFIYGNNLIQSLSTSFIMGYIIYYLLEYRPKVKETKVIMENYVALRIRKILTDFHNTYTMLATISTEIDSTTAGLKEDLNNMKNILKVKKGTRCHVSFGGDKDMSNYTVGNFIVDEGNEIYITSNEILNYIIYLDIDFVAILNEVIEESQSMTMGFKGNFFPDLELKSFEEDFIRNYQVYTKLKKYYE